MLASLLMVLYCCQQAVLLNFGSYDDYCYDVLLLLLPLLYQSSADNGICAVVLLLLLLAVAVAAAAATVVGVICTLLYL